MKQCTSAAKRGGNIAGNARRETEKEIGDQIVSKKNKRDITRKKIN